MLDVAGVTVQWIHNDVRGEIVCFYEDDIEYTILTTNAGFARGGCVHKLNGEHFVGLKGKVVYYIYSPDLTHVERQVYRIGESGYIIPNYPHYLVAVNDVVTLEWGATTEEKQEKHVEIRKIVDKINIEQCFLHAMHIADRSDL